ncbi:hypothetical protein, conserved [Eimeria maxima]|uniref:Uncharacterized protein n=1 Tax=Eimeria maxima TaxID=5804 RepID=U6MFT6_EIMMA|nr:hypothetical protein, conserved [Eimeria maxima]CDJ61324.1 hypothetical protein, conserved [Eimeria maxima]
MGATQSNESAAAALGTSQAGHKQYKSAVTPPLKHPHNESGEAQCPLPTDFPGKIKLSGLAAVDTTTCSTTTCNSSLSGVSTSPETRSTGLGGSANAAALTHFSGTPFERSDSAQAPQKVNLPPAVGRLQGAVKHPFRFIVELKVMQPTKCTYRPKGL